MMQQVHDSEVFNKYKHNLERIERLNTRLLDVLSKKGQTRPGLQGPGPEFFMKSAVAFAAEAMTAPAKLMEQQVSFWNKSFRAWMETQASADAAAVASPEADGNSGIPDLAAHPYFKLIQEQSRINAEAISRAANEVEGLEGGDKRRLEFFARQLSEMMSPANFLFTNPEALKRAVDTEGDSLVKGLENLVRDLERNDGELLITLADPDAFTVGGNIATTEGSVVFRNELFELIQYAPLTERVHRTPLVIVPPWINKYYILDLKPKNSFVKWTVEQGFTVFVVSWVNPDASHRDIGMDEYASLGCLKAIETVREITGEQQVNMVGYCIGGTLLALVLAYMSKRGDRSVRTATFLTTLTDFEDMGELSLFVEEDMLAGIEEEVAEKGFLPSLFMSRTFSYMRARDLVYGPAIRSYLMGEPPPAFDLLFWNGDSTNLPARMTIQYLRNLCQDNEFARGEFMLLGERIGLKDMRHPLIAIACETDHIAHWKGAYAGFCKMGSRDRDKTFVLSQSGHIAGIVNPPSKQKYGHYTCESRHDQPESWREHASFTEGTWWRLWSNWLSRRSGRQMPARLPGSKKYPELEKAPGSYVVGR